MLQTFNNDDWVLLRLVDRVVDFMFEIPLLCCPRCKVVLKYPSVASYIPVSLFPPLTALRRGSCFYNKCCVLCVSPSPFSSRFCLQLSSITARLSIV
jgi:hypothetical protein